MKRRATLAENTRERIIRATYELHSERGLASTRFRDIAARADVAVGTVYHHFPTYEDVIAACGAYTVAHTRPPSPPLGCAELSRQDRLARLVGTWFDFYRRFPGLERIRLEREQFPLVEAFIRDYERNHRELLAEATGQEGIDSKTEAAALALLDCSTYRRLLNLALQHHEAIELVARLLWRLLEADEHSTAAQPTAPVSTRQGDTQ